MSEARIKNVRTHLNNPKFEWGEGDVRFLLAEIDRLKDEYENVCKFATQYEAQREEARAQQAHTASCNLELMRKLDKANEALQFYANKESYYPRHVRQPCGCCSETVESIVAEDEGKVARKALGEKE